MLKNDQLDAWDRENFFHPSTHLAQHARGESPNRIVTGGSGVYIEDRDGTELLTHSPDFIASTSAMAVPKLLTPLQSRLVNWPITTHTSATAPKPPSRLHKW